MPWFRKAAPVDPLAVTMTGVKLGTRLIVLGIRDTKTIAALAVKVGLTGTTVVLDPDEAKLRAAGQQIEREGALVDLTHAAWTSAWPYDDEHFDVAVIQDVLPAIGAVGVVSCLHEVFRTLRAGGRVIVIESAPRRGFGALASRQSDRQPSAAGGDAVAALRAAGFAAVRVLAERDGTLFTEGAKRA